MPSPSLSDKPKELGILAKDTRLPKEHTVSDELRRAFDRLPDEVRRELEAVGALEKVLALAEELAAAEACDVMPDDPGLQKDVDDAGRRLEAFFEALLMDWQPPRDRPGGTVTRFERAREFYSEIGRSEGRQRGGRFTDDPPGPLTEAGHKGGYRRNHRNLFTLGGGSSLGDTRSRDDGPC